MVSYKCPSVDSQMCFWGVISGRERKRGEKKVYWRENFTATFSCTADVEMNQEPTVVPGERDFFFKCTTAARCSLQLDEQQHE